MTPEPTHESLEEGFHASEPRGEVEQDRGTGVDTRPLAARARPPEPELQRPAREASPAPVPVSVPVPAPGMDVTGVPIWLPPIEPSCEAGVPLLPASGFGGALHLLGSKMNSHSL